MKLLKNLSILVFVAALAACGGGEQPKNTNSAQPKANQAEPVNAAPNTATAPPANAPAPAGAEASKTPTVETKNTAETLKPVIAAWSAALIKKDEAALRKAYSAETLKSLQEDMKAEGKTSLAEFITELDPLDKPYEVRNEEISGNVGVVEIRGGSYPNGIKIKLIKENGEWKITNELPDFQKK